ncbi:hypothetical protein BN135_928 [Cronobacter muytjensii 530]
MRNRINNLFTDGKFIICAKKYSLMRQVSLMPLPHVMNALSY